MDAHTTLITVTGRDRPGLTSGLCDVLAETGSRIIDMEQVVIHDRLLLGILVALGSSEKETHRRLRKRATELGVDLEFERMPAAPATAAASRHFVTVLGRSLHPRAISALTGCIAGCGGNIDRIVRMSRYPIMSFELLVSGGDAECLRRELVSEAAAQQVDVAVQPANLYRRAKRLIVLDVDSTLIQGEIIERLAANAGCEEQVARITAAAMSGEVDFATALRERVALLEGTPESAVLRLRDELELTPGARTLIRTLRRLGYVIAIVSGGFTHVTDTLTEQLGFDYAAANVLEVRDGRLTGRLAGPIVDRAAKADWLERFAERAGVSLAQTVAIGDGANDLDMLERAGLGIAFNAKPVVREMADTAVTVPYLDAILFVLGITREEVEAADADDPDFVPPPPIPVPDEVT